MAVCSNGISHLLAESDPGLAVGLNPLNTDGRVNALVAALNADEDGLPATSLADAVAIVSNAPGDPRGYSLLGEVVERQGRTAEADQLYLKALAISGTEIHALLRLFGRSLARDDLQGAIGYLDRILRRWPDYWDKVSPVILTIALSENGSAPFAAVISENPPWRSQVLRFLVETPAAFPFVGRLLVSELNAGRSVSQQDLNTFMGALVAHRRPQQAYEIFLTSLPEYQRDRVGYVHNPTFLSPISGGYFDWRIKLMPGADVLTGDAGLTVQFIDAPTALGGVIQLTSIPPGRYQLVAEVEAAGLEVPKGLYWQLACDGTGEVLGKLDVPSGTYANHTIRQDLTVPDAACDAQRLVLLTGEVTASRREPYRGSVVFHSVRLNNVRGAL